MQENKSIECYVTILLLALCLPWQCSSNANPTTDGDIDETDTIVDTLRDIEEYYEDEDANEHEEPSCNVEISPSAVELDTLKPGESQNLVFRLMNDCPVSLDITSITISAIEGPSTWYTITSRIPEEASPVQVKTNGFHEITVRFSPDAGGNSRALLKIFTSNSQWSYLEASIAWNYAGISKLHVPGSLDFGTVSTLALEGKTLGLVISNSSGEENTLPLRIDSIDLADTSSIFQLDPATCDTNLGAINLLPGQSHICKVTATPGDADTFNTVIEVTSDATNGPSMQVVSLQVIGSAPRLVLIPPLLDFGTVNVWEEGAINMQIKNIGYVDTDISDITIEQQHEGVFSISPHTCLEETLSPEGICEITVTFSPLDITRYGGSINVFGSNEKLTSGSLSGEGKTPVNCAMMHAGEPREQCKQWIFDPSSQNHSDPCVLGPANEFETCDDNDICTVGEYCSNGSCCNGLPKCDDGLTCTEDSCNNQGLCNNQLLPDWCLIDARCIPAGIDPDNSCMTCDPSENPLYLVPMPDNSACEDDTYICTSDICNNGECVHTLLPDYCLIEGQCIQHNQNMDDEICMFCDASRSTDSWSTNDFMTCDDDSANTVQDYCLDGACMGWQDSWSLLDGTIYSEYGPNPQQQLDIAYDRHRHRLVVLDWSDGDIWEWDHLSWIKAFNFYDSGCVRGVECPQRRSMYGFVFDHSRNRAVLFGGRRSSNTKCEEGGNDDDERNECAFTWEWNGQSAEWVLADGNRYTDGVTGPSARNYHAMTYSGHEQVTFLFGGYYPSKHCYEKAGDYCGFLWAWDGQRWTLKDDTYYADGTTGPAARRSPSMAYDENRQRLVLFGGYGKDDCYEGAGKYCGATWEWDGANWHLSSHAFLHGINGPMPRKDAIMTYDEARGKVVLFAGEANGDCHEGSSGDAKYCNLVWEWNGTAWVISNGVIYEQNSDDGPAGRAQAGADYDSMSQRVLLFGGTGNCNEDGSGQCGFLWGYAPE